MKEEFDKERNHKIDLLRGIAILLVVLGHITRTNTLHDYIWSFHIPLFFFISGYLYNPLKFASFETFIRKKTKGLIIPYLIFGGITFFYWLLVESKFRASDLNPVSQLFGLFYGTRYGHYLDFNGPLWFIPCLFSMTIIYYFIGKRNKLIGFIGCMTLFVIGVLCSDYISWLPFGLCAAFIGIIFYWGGQLLHCHHTEYVRFEKFVSNHKPIIVSLTLSLIALQVVLTPYSEANLARFETGNPFIYVSLAFLGIIIYWIIAVIINQSNLLEWLGRNSLVIFAFHGPVYRALIFVTYYFTHLGVVDIRQDILLCVLISILTILCLIPLIQIWNKWGKFGAS